MEIPNLYIRTSISALLTYTLEFSCSYGSFYRPSYLPPMYEWIHLAHHSKDYKPVSSLGKKLRDAHMSHHFHNENYNWGITNMIGDYFFGTLKDNKSIKKSATAKSIAGYTD